MSRARIQNAISSLKDYQSSFLLSEYIKPDFLNVTHTTKISTWPTFIDLQTHKLFI